MTSSAGGCCILAKRSQLTGAEVRDLGEPGSDISSSGLLHTRRVPAGRGRRCANSGNTFLNQSSERRAQTSMPAVVKDAESRAAGIRYERLPDERLRRYDGFVTTVTTVLLLRFVTTVTTVRYNGYSGSNSYSGYDGYNSYNGYSGYERVQRYKRLLREHATLQTTSYKRLARERGVLERLASRSRSRVSRREVIPGVKD